LKKKINLLKIKGIGTFHLQGFNQFETYFSTVLEEEKFLKKEKIIPILYNSSDYPKTLTFFANAPLVLFQKGNVLWKNEHIVSIVGTRNPTSRGVDFCKQLIKELAVYHPIIVSGFAKGIDVVAHKTAMENNLETVACLGHGLNQIFPKEHQAYVDSICKKGVFLSEFWSNSSFENTNFLKRNRIITGLSHATVVIESGVKGGSLVTAEHAHHYGRDVFTVPGRISDSQSKGCLNLIRKDKARMITSVADLVYWMGWESKITPQNTQKELLLSLTEEEKEIFNLLENKNSLDNLAFQAKLPISKVAVLLFQLEVKG